MEPPRIATSFATLARFDPQPRRQLVGIRIQAARPLRHLEFHLDGVGPQILADCVPRQACPPLDLADRHVLSVMPPANDAQQLHVDRSNNPDDAVGEVAQTRVISQRKLRPSPGQISMQRNNLALYRSEKGTSFFSQCCKQKGFT